MKYRLLRILDRAFSDPTNGQKNDVFNVPLVRLKRDVSARFLPKPFDSFQVPLEAELVVLPNSGLNGEAVGNVLQHLAVTRCLVGCKPKPSQRCLPVDLSR
jgi:hypothetical protein